MQKDPLLLLDDCVPDLFCAHAGSAAPFCGVPCGAPGVLCPATQGCAAFDGPGPTALCHPRCSLLDQDCSRLGDGCYVLRGPDGMDLAACLPAAGSGTSGDACTRASGCAPGFLCIEADLDSVSCDGQARCCSPLCDTSAPGCTGANPTCYALNLAGEDLAGFCGKA